MVMVLAGKLMILVVLVSDYAGGDAGCIEARDIDGANAQSGSL